MANGPALPMSVSALRSARPEDLDDAARGWRTISGRLDAQVSALRKDVIAPVEDPGNWDGVAQRTAADGLEGHARGLDALREYAEAMAVVLSDAAVGVADARAYLRAADDLAYGHGLRIGPDGAVTSVTSPPPIFAAAAAGERSAADEVSALVRRALTLAEETDTQVTARLREIGRFAGVDSGRTAAAKAQLVAAGKLKDSLDRSAIPPRGTDPAEVSAWWRALPTDGRQRLISEWPSAVGWLDGVPATARNQANRLALARERDQLRARLRSLERREPPQYTMQPTGLHDAQAERLNPAWQRWNDEVTQVRGKLGAIQAVEGGLEQAGSMAGAGNVYLLGFDTDGNGHGIVAVGNPDTATDTVTYVPGLGSKLSGAGGDISRATLLWQQATKDAGPGQRVSSVYWLGYDAPQLGADLGGDLAVAGTGDAVAGARSLARFESGLAATHEAGVPRHSTVLGHSYGSLVVGEAAARDGMRPGDIITVGSPGVGVDHATQLGLPPSHVWAGANSHDPVPQLANPWTSLSDPDAAWFGNNPATPAFGGQVFDANKDPARSFGPGPDFAAHSSYWDWHSSSLKNMAHIVDGQYARVSAKHESPPPNPNDPPPIPLGPGGI